MGEFRISPFRVNHSVPDSMGVCLETPVGKIFHVPDFKFDLTPLDGKVFDFQRAVRLAEGKVLALFSDCLGATEGGFTRSEREIEEVFSQILAKSKAQVFITTLSSSSWTISALEPNTEEELPQMFGLSIKTKFFGSKSG